MYNGLVLFLVLLSFVGCAHYSKQAVYNTTESVDGHTRLYNEKLNLSSLNYGDVKFALSDKQFKDQYPEEKPIFKHVIFYGRTIVAPYYDYYVLEKNNGKEHPNYIFFEFSLQHKKFVLAISKEAPKTDENFIRNHLSTYLK